MAYADHFLRTRIVTAPSVFQDNHYTKCIQSIYLSDVSNDPEREHPKYSPLNRGKDEGQRDRHPSWSTQPAHSRNKTQITMFTWYLHQICNCTKVKCPRHFHLPLLLLDSVCWENWGYLIRISEPTWHEEVGLSDPQAGPELHKSELLTGTNTCKPSEDGAWCLVERKMWAIPGPLSVSWVSSEHSAPAVTRMHLKHGT